MNKQFITSLMAKKRSEGTVKGYVDDVQHALDYIGKPDDEIRLVDLESWQSSISNLSSATIARRTAAVKEYFKFLYRNELIAKNPAEFLEAPAVKNREKSALEAEDVRAMVNVATNDRNKAIIMMLAQTGLRISELANITLEQYKSRINNTLVIRGKGDKDRLVGLSDETVNLIDRYISKSRKDGSEYLFVGNQGNRLDGKNTSAMLRTTARKAGLENCEISNHTMRRTFATLLSESNVPVEVISKAMGHSSIQMTSHYIKRTEQRAVSAMATVNF